MELAVKPAAKHAKDNQAHLDGNKAAPRGGANNGIVDHHMVDKIDHAGHASRAKGAMAEMGHYNVSYYDGGHHGGGGRSMAANSPHHPIGHTKHKERY